MPNIELGKTLTALRKEKHYMQADVIRKMADAGCNVATGTFSRWENDKAVPQANEFLNLCMIYGVRDVIGTFVKSSPSYADPLSKDGRDKVEEYERILIASNLFAPAGKILPFPQRQRRVYEEDRPSAGTGTFLDSPNYVMVDIGDDIPDCVDFGLKISGDSMEPAFHDGQTVWLHQQPVVEDGEIGIFFLNGQSFIKKFKTTKDGVQLISLNYEKYAPIIIGENDDLRVFGKVIH